MQTNKKETRGRPQRNGYSSQKREVPQNNQNRNSQPNHHQPNKQKLPIIKLNRDPKDIKLNEEQAKQVSELSSKIDAIGKVEMPNNEIFEKKKEEFDKNISDLYGKISQTRSSLDENQKKKEEFIKVHFPHTKEINETNEKIKKINDILNPIQEKFNKIKESRKSLISTKSEMKNKSHGRSADQISDEIDEINYQIETETLSNQQLREKLAKIENLKKIRSKLSDVGDIDTQINRLRDSENELFQRIHELREQRSQLYDFKNSFKNDQKDASAKNDEFKKERDALHAQLNDLQKQVVEQRRLKQEFMDQYYAEKKETAIKRNELALLNNQRLQVYQEAERHMDLLEKGARQAGPIQERRNPYTQKIDAAKSLVCFLENMTQQDSVEDQKIKDQGKASTQSQKDLIASIRKPSKKERKNAKKSQNEEKRKPIKFDYSLETIRQFVLVEVKQPNKEDEIPETIKKLNDLINQWSNAFVKVSFKFNILADGSVKPIIKIE